MDIYDTLYMLAAIEQLDPEPSFFKRRYFPTNTDLGVFGTSKVLADYREGNRKAAPFVIPRIGALPVGRGGFSTLMSWSQATSASADPSPSTSSTSAASARAS